MEPANNDNQMTMFGDLGQEWRNAKGGAENILQNLYRKMYEKFLLYSQNTGSRNFTNMWKSDMFKTNVLDIYAVNGVVMPNMDKTRNSMYASMAFAAIKDWFP